MAAGLLMGIASAPANLWPLAWIVLAPLWLLSQVQTPQRAVLSGLVWGLGYHGLVLSWVTGLHPLTWMGVPWLASLAIAWSCWGLVALWGAILSAIWAGVMAWLTPKQSSGTRLLFGITCWCCLEWLWMHSPLSWTSLSFTQSPGNLVILHLGQLAGPLTVTTALVIINGLIAEVWLRPSQRRPALGVIIGILIGVHLLGWGLYSRPLAQAPGRAIEIGIVQGNIPTRIKLSAQGVNQSLKNYTSGYLQLADQGVDAVLTPEGALPFLWVGGAQGQNQFEQAVRSKGVPVWLGTFAQQEDRITQSLLTLIGNGEIIGRYNKIKLVPLGEYVPFEETLGKLVARLSPIEARMLPGLPNQKFETPFGQGIAGICFDSAFPQLFQAQAAAGGEFILVASNNDPYNQMMLAQHFAQDVMRAIETDRWAAQATNTGYSGIVDPHGRTQWISEINTYEIHTGTIYRRQTRTPYVRWGNWLTPLLIVWTGVVWVQHHRPRESYLNH